MEPVVDPTCAACRAIDREDGTEDGEIRRAVHRHVRHERTLFGVLKHAEGTAADRITRFAGSMKFVYAHGVWFGLWIALNVGLAGIKREFDKFPFGLLTMVVSLEAIFLATFVMISQNRQAARSDIRSQLDYENNLRSEIWAVHIGQALGVDADHVEEVIRRAILATEEHIAEVEAR